MKKIYFLLSIVIMVSFLFLEGCCLQDRKEKTEKTALWPEIEPYQTDYLKVSDIHEIYYELLGNKKGKPVFFSAAINRSHCHQSMGA